MTGRDLMMLRLKENFRFSFCFWEERVNGPGRSMDGIWKLRSQEDLK
jgi:hypothetical protein